MEIITKKTAHVVILKNKIAKNKKLYRKGHACDKVGCFWNFPDSSPYSEG